MPPFAPAHALGDHEPPHSSQVGSSAVWPVPSPATPIGERYNLHQSFDLNCTLCPKAFSGGRGRARSARGSFRSRACIGNMNPPVTPLKRGTFAQRTNVWPPSWEGSGVGRFMESFLSLWRIHWDHELWKTPASRTHSKRFAKSQALGHCAAAFGVR